MTYSSGISNDDVGGLNDIFDKLLSLMQDHGIILPNEFATMARSLSMIESVSSNLDPNVDMMASIEPIATTEVKKQKSSIQKHSSVIRKVAYYTIKTCSSPYCLFLQIPFTRLKTVI